MPSHKTFKRLGKCLNGYEAERVWHPLPPDLIEILLVKPCDWHYLRDKVNFSFILFDLVS